MLDAICSMFSQPSPNAIGTGLWFRALSAYRLADVRAAFDAHLTDPQRGRFAPKPADIIAQLDRDDGRPGAQEAWAAALRARDEAATVVWTDETAEAFGICRPVLLLGDEVGARMTFIEAYERMVRDARARHLPVHAWVSRGHDRAEAQAVIRQAVSDGLLPVSELAALAAPAGSVPLLGAQPPDAARRDEWLSVLREMSAAIKAGFDAPTGPSHADLDRADTALRKEKAQEAVRRYTAGSANDGKAQAA
ncbi:MAG: hypothetical protein LBH31_00600 [Burkholderiaceae bacterium]|nr:hypothetical protein [Burkholderiaceae bacterium]